MKLNGLICGVPGLFLAGAAAGQYDPKEPLRPELILLARARVVAAENAKRIPDFVCGMTIERSRRRKGGGRFELIDTLRMEVAYVGGKEMYGWPGARKFEDRDLTEMVGRQGAIGTGDFTSHVQSVLLGAGAVIQYHGEEQLDGRATHRFDFEVARTRSRYTVRLPPVEDVVGYRGSFWVDRISFDVVRLLIDIVDVPPTLPLTSSRKVITQARQRIGEAEFLLPATAEMEMELADGTTTMNRTVFENCHQFRSESTLVFEEPVDTGPAVPPTVQVTLPAGLRVQLNFKDSLDLKKVGIGDQVPLVVAKDARMKDEVVVPKGADFMARVADLQCVNTATSGCFLVLRVESFRFGNKEGEVEMELDAPRIEDSPWARMVDRRSNVSLLPDNIVRPPRGAGTLALRGGRIRVGAGYPSVWRVLPPAASTAKERGSPRP